MRQALSQVSSNERRAVQPMNPAADILRSTQSQKRFVSRVTTLALAQFAQLSGVGEANLEGLVDYGVLTPVTSEGESWAFDIGCVMTLQRAERLRRDLALDGHAFALAVMLLNQITALERQLCGARLEVSARPGAQGTFMTESNAKLSTPISICQP